jgi:hypothetical protein
MAVNDIILCSPETPNNVKLYDPMVGCSTAALNFQTISASVIVVATLTDILTYVRTLSASIISIGTISTQSLFRRTLSASISLLASLAGIFIPGSALYFQTMSASVLTVTNLSTIFTLFQAATKYLSIVVHNRGDIHPTTTKRPYQRK